MKYWLLILTQAFPLLYASELTINVINQDKVAMRHVVATLEPDFITEPYTPIPKDKVISQINNTFEPFITVINKGSKIRFPNYDLTAHHVYSFSPAKTFELKLYTKMPEHAVTFDKAGPVSLGCGIHDNMEAYVFVTDKEHTQVSNRYGEIKFKGLEEGSYRLTLWHPHDEGVYTPKDIWVFNNRKQYISLMYSL